MLLLLTSLLGRGDNRQKKHHDCAQTSEFQVHHNHLSAISSCMTMGELQCSDHLALQFLACNLLSSFPPDTSSTLCSQQYQLFHFASLTTVWTYFVVPQPWASKDTVILVSLLLDARMDFYSVLLLIWSQQVSWVLLSLYNVIPCPVLSKCFQLEVNAHVTIPTHKWIYCLQDQDYPKRWLLIY